MTTYHVTESILRRSNMYWPLEDKRGTILAFVSTLPPGCLEVQLTRLAPYEYTVVYEGVCEPLHRYAGVEEHWECIFVGCGPGVAGTAPVVALALAETVTCSYHCAGWEHTYTHGIPGERRAIPLIPGRVSFHITFPAR